MRKIFIDVGHGGADPGASAYGIKEKDRCLKISLLLRDLLNEQYTGHSIKLSRSTDKTLSLPERTKIANQWGADLLVSIHVNAGGGTGFESYTYRGNYRNREVTNSLRQIIHQNIVKATGLKNRGLKEANYHMLRESTMSAILTENGFIDHPSDVKKLKTAAFLTKIARGHAKGIADALQLKRKSSFKKDGSIFHTIKRGDTLWSLARNYGTTVQKLKWKNDRIDPYKLQIGSKLKIK